MTGTAPEPTTVTRFMEQAGEAASRLHENLRMGYTRGYEYELADAIYDGLTEPQRREVLEFLVFDHLMTWPMIGGVLDETDQESYDTLRRVADVLTTLALKQGLGHNHIALRRRIADYICDQQRMMPAAA